MDFEVLKQFVGWTLQVFIIEQYITADHARVVQKFIGPCFKAKTLHHDAK
jgi:hypothetical protein